MTFQEIEGINAAKRTEFKSIYSVKLEGRMQKNSSCEVLWSLKAKEVKASRLGFECRV